MNTHWLHTIIYRRPVINCTKMFQPAWNIFCRKKITYLKCRAVVFNQGAAAPLSDLKNSRCSANFRTLCTNYAWVPPNFSLSKGGCHERKKIEKHCCCDWKAGHMYNFLLKSGFPNVGKIDTFKDQKFTVWDLLNLSSVNALISFPIFS